MSRSAGPSNPLTRLERWAAATEWPLMAAALLFLAAYAWPVLEPGLPAAALLACAAVSWVAWTAFALDFTVRVALAPDRPRYVLRHLHDLDAAGRVVTAAQVEALMAEIRAIREERPGASRADELPEPGGESVAGRVPGPAGSAGP